MIYLIAPNAVTPSGGVGVAAQWVRLLNQHGHDAMFITPNGDPSPYWLNFTVPAGSYADVVDAPENKVIHVWLDCMHQFRTSRAQLYYFAQDVCQPQYIECAAPGRFEAEYLPLLRSCKLAVLTHHAKWYYLYRWGLQSKIVNNFVDSELFKPLEKDPNAVCMIRHRDHYSPEIAEKLKKAGFTVRIAEGSQEEIARVMGECLFFISDARGRWDGYEYSEGMPCPIMEAMASGCVVFCRDTNGVREFIEPGINAHFYSESPNPELVIEVMRDCGIHNNPIREAAVRTIQKRFNERTIWHQIKEALEL